MIGLVVRFKYGNFVQLAVSMAEAERIIDSWGKWTPGVGGGRVLAGSNQHGTWAINLEDVQVIHTAELQLQGQQGMLPGQHIKPGRGMSGYSNN